MARFLLEGEWLGYRSSQDKIVHREVITDAKLAAWAMKTYGITYTDGTTLRLTCRPTEPRERVTPVDHGYSDLIRKCFRARRRFKR